jgi:hypothetical protein
MMLLSNSDGSSRTAPKANALKQHPENESSLSEMVLLKQADINRLRRILYVLTEADQLAHTLFGMERKEK